MAVNDAEIDSFLQKVEQLENVLKDSTEDSCTSQSRVEPTSSSAAKSSGSSSNSAPTSASTLRSLEQDAEERAKARQKRIKEANLLKNEGNGFFREQEWSKAVEKYTEAMKIQGDMSVLYTNRAVALFNNGDPEGSIADCDKVLELEEFHSHLVDFRKNESDSIAFKALARKGKALMELERVDEAEECFKRCAEQRPNDEVVSRLLEEVQVEKQKKNHEEQVVMRITSDENLSNILRNISEHLENVDGCVNDSQKMELGEVITLLRSISPVSLRCDALRVTSLLKRLYEKAIECHDPLLVHEIASVTDCDVMNARILVEMGAVDDCVRIIHAGAGDVDPISTGHVRVAAFVELLESLSQFDFARARMLPRLDFSSISSGLEGPLSDVYAAFVEALVQHNAFLNKLSCVIPHFKAVIAGEHESSLSVTRVLRTLVVFSRHEGYHEQISQSVAKLIVGIIPRLYKKRLQSSLEDALVVLTNVSLRFYGVISRLLLENKSIPLLIKLVVTWANSASLAVRSANLLARCCSEVKELLVSLNSQVKLISVLVNSAGSRTSNEWIELCEHVVRILAEVRPHLLSAELPQNFMKVVSELLNFQSTNPRLVGNLALVLSEIVSKEEYAVQLMELGAVENLLAIADDSANNMKAKNAAICLGKMCRHPQCLLKVKNLHGLEILNSRIGALFHQ